MELSFEQSMKRLDEIVKLLENGDLPLDESMKLFEEGSILCNNCSGMLNQAEEKIKQLHFKNDSVDYEEFSE